MPTIIPLRFPHPPCKRPGLDWQASRTQESRCQARAPPADATPDACPGRAPEQNL